MNGKTIYDESPYIFLILTGSSSLHLNYNSDAARRLKTKITNLIDDDLLLFT